MRSTLLLTLRMIYCILLILLDSIHSGPICICLLPACRKKERMCILELLRKKVSKLINCKLQIQTSSDKADIDPGTRYYRNWRMSILAIISMPFDTISHFFELSKGSETLTFCFVCKLLLSLLVAPLSQGFKDFKNTQLKHPVASKTRH